jgi:hypothetical protein
VFAEVEVADAQVGDFLHACAAVVEEQQQGAVAQRESAVVGQVGEQVLDLVAFEELRLGWGGAFHWDGHDPLADAEHLWCAGGDVVEQRVQRGEPLVAGADVVATVVFEVAQERDDPFEAEVGQLQAGDLGPLVGGDEQQEQADGVAVAAHRRRSQPLDGDQVLEEERLDEWAKRWSSHGAACSHAGSANASKRRLASVSSPGVICR